MTSRAPIVQPDLQRLKKAYPTAFMGPVRKRLPAALIFIPLFALFIFGMAWLGFSAERLLNGISRLRIILGLMFPPAPGNLLPLYLGALGETLSIAFLGTMLAAILAFPIAFVAAKNIVAQSLIHFLSRRVLDVIRGVDTLIWALIFINVVGLGPFAGILAIAMSDLGSFGKLFSEAIETADKRAREGVQSTGGSLVHEIVLGVIPRVLPVILSQVLYYFESNTRSATVIGIVGAGGIGLYLSNEISQQNWDHVAFLILIILITVSIIDQISSRLRFAIIGPVTRRD